MTPCAAVPYHVPMKMPKVSFSLTPEQRAAFVALGRLGGQTRKRNMSKAARAASARKAARARWKDHTPKAKRAKRRRPRA